MRFSTRMMQVAGTLALTAATTTWAGIHEKGYELGVYGGIENGDHRTQVPARGAYGFRAAYAFTKKIMAEMVVDSFPTTRDVTIRVGNPSLPASQVATTITPDARFMSYSVGLMANFMTERDVKTTPYFNVNLGFITEDRGGGRFSVRTVPSNPGSVVSGEILAQKDTGTLLTVGAGARSFLTDTIGLRYEIKYIHHDSFGINQDGLQGTVGATFVLGGKK
jgi:outer membrane protein with beta-barrel domain